MTIGRLSRRNFILSALAAASVVSFGVPTFTNDLENLEKVVQSFPAAPLAPSNSPLHMTFFMHNATVDGGQLGFRCSNVVVDCEKSYNIHTFLSEDVTELTFDRPRPNVSAIVSGANRVALQTRRGKGNNYAVMSDHVLIWYKGKSIYDTPIQRAGNNLAYNPNYKEYFVRVKGVALSQSDHDMLKTIGFERVI